MSRKLLIFIYFFLFALVGNCYAGYSRVVSLAPSLTSSLYDLDSQDCIVGVTIYCKAEGKQIIGTTLEPNVEEIISLKPDLVLAVKGWNGPVVLDKIKAAGLNIISFEPANNFEDICRNFLLLGKLMEKEKLASDIVFHARHEVDQIFSNAKNLPKKSIFWQLGEKPLVTVNDSAFIGDLIRFSGGTNLFSDFKVMYAVVSYEEVVKRNPQIIIIATMGDAAISQKEYWLGIKKIDASKNKSVFIIDADNICQPTPLRFVRGLKEIAGLVYAGIGAESR